MAKLILLRHGQSRWNQLNRFTGWVDVDLTPKGIEEALKAGERIQKIPVDILFTSALIRAQMTGSLAMSRHASQRPLVFMHQEGKEKKWGTESCSKEPLDACIPTYVSWHLNERYYGELQGKNKDEVKREFGEEQVHIWRRSFDTPPPGGESLKMTLERTLPYFKEQILPELEKGKNVLVAAHGNSLRSIVMFLDHLNEEEILKLEIPTGEPMVYNFIDSAFKRSL